MASWWSLNKSGDFQFTTQGAILIGRQTGNHLFTRKNAGTGSSETVQIACPYLCNLICLSTQVHAELKAGPLAHMPSGRFQANAAWLVAATMTHNLMRTTATIVGGALARARALSIRQKIITVPARIAHRARRLIMHLPTGWKWARAFTRLWNTALSPPPQESRT